MILRPDCVNKVDLTRLFVQFSLNSQLVPPPPPLPLKCSYQEILTFVLRG